MNVNVVLSIERDIVKNGLETIISNGILASKVFHSPKSELIEKIKLLHHDIVIIDVENNNDEDLKLIDKIVCSDPNIQLFILTNRKLNRRILSYVNLNSVELILETYSCDDILKLIKNTFRRNNRTRLPLRIRKKKKTQNLLDLLSNREFEIGLMLLKGETLSSISAKQNLAITTISTYKRRLFEKTNSKNIMQMADVFKRQNV